MTKKALELNDKDYRVWCNLLLDERNRKNEAGAKDARKRTEELLEDYVKKHPQDATAQSWMAIFRSEEQQKEQALQFVESAVALAPKDSLVLENVAETYENLGDRGQAVKYAEESMKNGSGLADLQSRPGLKKVLDDKSFHASGNN
jgi:eukaryotic-like serine/threonine-protein kinase